MSTSGHKLIMKQTFHIRIEITSVENMNGTITITFGDVTETFTGMEKHGILSSEGNSREQILDMYTALRRRGGDCYLFDIAKILGVDKVENGYDGGDAVILVCKSGLETLGGDANKLYEVLKELNWDKRRKNKGKEVNAIARRNLCFGDTHMDQDLSVGRGTVYSFEEVSGLGDLRRSMGDILGPTMANLNAEGNHYYDHTKCYIGWHGDRERRKVAGFRFGSDFNLSYRWYHKSQVVSPTLNITLSHGDFYVMGDKAVGFDWLKKNTYTLRHSAGVIPK
jgi:alkylated DNA repair dioxygenase AlkB